MTATDASAEAPRSLRCRVAQAVAYPFDVRLIFEQDVEWVGDSLIVESANAQGDQGPRPVHGLADRRRLAYGLRPDPGHEAGDPIGQDPVEVGNPAEQDLGLPFDARIPDVQEQTPSLERLGEFPGVVRGQEHGGWLGGGGGAPLA